jgi:hypothetical protein
MSVACPWQYWAVVVGCEHCAVILVSLFSLFCISTVTRRMQRYENYVSVEMSLLRHAHGHSLCLVSYTWYSRRSLRMPYVLPHLPPFPCCVSSCPRRFRSLPAGGVWTRSVRWCLRSIWQTQLDDFGASLLCAGHVWRLEQ